MEQKGNINGSFLGMAAFAMFACGYSLFKGVYAYKDSSVSAWDVSYWQGLLLFFYNAIANWITGNSIFDVGKENVGPIFCRCLFGMIGNILLTVQFQMLSLIKAQAIVFTYPLWTVLNARLLLGERISKWDVISMATAFSGVAIVVVSEYLKITTGAEQTDAYPILGVIVGLVATFMISLGDVYTRKIGMNVSPMTTPAYLGLFIAAGSALYLLFVGRASALDYVGYIPLLIFAGSTSIAIAFYLLTKAFQLDLATRVGAFTYVQIIVSGMVDTCVFGTKIESLDVLGYSLIIFGNLGFVILKLTGIISS